MLEQHLNRLKKQPPMSLELRVELLKKLKNTINEWQHKIIEALHRDFSHRAETETRIAEIMLCIDEINYCIQHLPAWNRGEEKSSSWKFYPSRSAIKPQPLGVVGVMSPWNYPFNLAISPLIIAIAAGNKVMVKPSEVTAHTSELIKEMLQQVFTENQVVTCLGDVDVAIAFSELNFDHLLFTGSTSVGREVMKKAAQNLVPVTLELGGKSPVLIDHGYNLKKAAQSIVAGKFFNAGQTCIAPDYIIIDKERMNALAQALKQEMQRQFGDFITNSDYSSIVSESHYKRLTDLLGDLQTEQMITSDASPSSNPEKRRLRPTIVTNISADHPLMQDEIFGPILPIMLSDDLDSAIQYVQSKPRPLTLYLFSNRKKTIRKVTQKTISGSLCVNETLVQFAQKDLPFGGVGESGMGRYHGYSGFAAMSHMKSVYYQSRINLNHLVRAPFSKVKKKIISWL